MWATCRYRIRLYEPRIWGQPSGFRKRNLLSLYCVHRTWLIEIPHWNTYDKSSALAVNRTKLIANFITLFARSSRVTGKHVLFQVLQFTLFRTLILYVTNLERSLQESCWIPSNFNEKLLITSAFTTLYLVRSTLLILYTYY